MGKKIEIEKEKENILNQLLFTFDFRAPQINQFQEAVHNENNYHGKVLALRFLFKYT